MSDQEEFKFSLFEPVQKRSGYRFHGVIVSRYHTLRGEARYVVECIVKGVDGCQHIFKGEQLHRRRA